MKIKISPAIERIYDRVCLAFFAMSSSVLTAFATDGANNDIEKGVIGATEEVWKIFKTVVGPIAAVAVCWSGFKLLIGSAREAETAKTNLLRIVFACGLILLAPLAIKSVIGWFDGSWQW